MRDNANDTPSKLSGTQPTAGFVNINGFTLRAGLIRLRDRAAELNLHPITIKRACAAGNCGFVRIGDLMYLTEQHVADWLASQERPARKAA